MREKKLLLLLLLPFSMAVTELLSPPETTVDLFPVQNDLVVDDQDDEAIQKSAEDETESGLQDDDEEKQRLEELLAKLSRVLNQVRTMKLKLRRRTGRTDAAAEEEDAAKM